MEQRATPRVSVACGACRNQHLRCDAQRPICGRCRSLARACSYPESRRSTKFRLQKRAAATGAAVTAAIAASPHQLQALTPAYTASNVSSDALLGSDSSQSPSVLTVRSWSDTDFSLLDLYYEYFHPSHPFVLPQRALQARLSLIDDLPSLRLLVNVMQYIGSCYKNPVARSHNLQASIYASDAAVDGFTVQSTLLMSLAESMCDEALQAEKLFERALAQARLIGMNKKCFADAEVEFDPVLAESWRRTWWMTYVVDANYCIIRRDYKMALMDAENSVDLPCEDEAYDRLNIPPTPSTMSEYQCREYAWEDKSFSSFAYLIDANRIYVKAIRSSTQYSGISQAEIICADMETEIASWFIMLPSSKRYLPVKQDAMDQLMFQAHLMMYTALVFIHRPLSNLGYNAAEALSGCGSTPPPLRPEASIGSLMDHQKHADKLFDAIQKQNQCLILLPMRAAQMSPFLICAVACSTIAHLVACKAALEPDEAEIARCRIRISMGTLKHYQDIWPKARKILTQLKKIAHAILQAGAVIQAPVADFEMLAEQDAMFAHFFDKDWLQAFEASAA